MGIGGVAGGGYMKVHVTIGQEGRRGGGRGANRSGRDKDSEGALGGTRSRAPVCKPEATGRRLMGSRNTADVQGPQGHPRQQAYTLGAATGTFVSQVRSITAGWAPCGTPGAQCHVCFV